MTGGQGWQGRECRLDEDFWVGGREDDVSIADARESGCLVRGFAEHAIQKSAVRLHLSDHINGPRSTVGSGTHLNHILCRTHYSMKGWYPTSPTPKDVVGSGARQTCLVCNPVAPTPSRQAKAEVLSIVDVQRGRINRR